MVKLLETTAEKISGLVRNKRRLAGLQARVLARGQRSRPRRFVLYPNSMCYFHGDFEVPGGEIFYTEIAEVRGAVMNRGCWR
jgi:hypothetical protein